MSEALTSRPLSSGDLNPKRPQGNQANNNPRPARDAAPAGQGQPRQNRGQGNGNNQNRQGQNRNSQGGNRTSGNQNGGGQNRNGNGNGQRRERGSLGRPPRQRMPKGPQTFVHGTFNSNGNGVPRVAAVDVKGVSKIDAGKLKIIPLGGLNQIGKNIMALEYEDDIIIMDMGFTFPGDDQPGIDLVVPDVTYLEERKHKIRGIVITHAHEDHVGGIPFILPKIPAPIYAAKFTIKFIERKLEEYKLPFKPELHIVDQDKHDRIQLGAFNVEFIRTTHSIPDACSLAIRTPVGMIVNTGDWRFEDNPLDGKVADKQRLKELGDEGVLMLMCDSTSCEKPGRSTPEAEIVDTIDEILVRNYNKRVVVAAFGSQITRMQIVINAVDKAKRKLAVVGRSMQNNLELAVKLGYVKVPPGLLIKSNEISKYDDGQIVVLSTGSQGETFSALQRMGAGDHRDMKLKPNDVVVLSASIIPGNEKSVWGMVDNLFRWGAYVYQPATAQFDDLGSMHTGGHATVDEIKEMIQLTRPKYYLPIHGEMHHMFHNAAIAKTEGIPDENLFVIENGQTLIADGKTIKEGPKVTSGVVLIDGAGIGDVQEIVLKDRLAMSSDGVFMAIATIDKRTGKLKVSPDIISRGFIYMKDNVELVQKSRQIVQNIFDKRDISTPANSLIIKTRVRDELANYLFKVTKRNPIVLPVVIEV
ncbi:MAG: ribonuclease J [Candidatus Saccharibacteria bacterium]